MDSIQYLLFFFGVASALIGLAIGILIILLLVKWLRK